MDELKNKIEAILFASGKGVGEEDLTKYCEVDVKDVRKALKKLEKEFTEREGSLIITHHNKKWKLTVRGKYTQDVQHLVSETELPLPILKTLAVIAYKSPVLQADVVNMRGQVSYDHIKELVKEKFITKEESGRTFILKITDKFYNYFDVEGDGEIREVFKQLKERQDKMIELAVVEASKEEGSGDNPLGNLKVVDSKPIEGQDHEGIFDENKPRVKERTEEEKKEEESFLKNVDSKIEELSQRIEKHKLPERKVEEEKTESEEENKEEEEENYI